MYICPLEKEVKCQGKDYRGFRSDDPSLRYYKMVYQVKERVRNLQVTPFVASTTPMFSQPDHVCHHNVHLNSKFPWSRSTHGMQ